MMRWTERVVRSAGLTLTLTLGLALALALAGCGGGDAGAGAGAEVSTAAADSARPPADDLGPGVTVDTQTIEDSTVAEMYISEDSAGG
jgi:hypothetical protein